MNDFEKKEAMWNLYEQHSDVTITTVMRDLISIDFESLLDCSFSKDRNVDADIKIAMMDSINKLDSIKLMLLINNWQAENEIL